MRIEIRNDSVLLDGYINTVDRESRVLPSPRGRFKEKIMPKTFEKALMRGENVDLLFNHDKSKKLGSTSSGELELREDNIGLRGIATVSNPEVIKAAENGELRGWSFGFVSRSDTWTDGTDGIARRTIEDLDLLEVSILTNTPAYIATSIEARGEESLVSEQRNEEFNATLTDNSTKTEETKKVDENRQVDFTEVDLELAEVQMELAELTLAILKMKGIDINEPTSIA